MTPDLTPARDAASGQATAASPIADLSYRNYDGPIHDRSMRWWVVTLATLRPIPRKPLFWIGTALAVFPYFITGLILYFKTAAQNSNPMMPLTPDLFAVNFYQAFVAQSFFVFLIALLVGSAAVASDIRANALQVYLSKPLTKGDYILGKWFGIFIPVFAVSFIPAFVFYLFCLLSYSSEGFLTQDRLLIFRLILATAIPAILHSSLLLGFSAWSKTPFLAGAMYAALYFVSKIVSSMVWLFKTIGIHHKLDPTRGVLIQHMHVAGIIDGLAQNAYAVTLHPTFVHRRGMSMETVTIPPPPLLPLLAVAVALTILGIAAARARIRAVEVVRG